MAWNQRLWEQQLSPPLPAGCPWPIPPNSSPSYSHHRHQLSLPPVAACWKQLSSALLDLPLKPSSFMSGRDGSITPTPSILHQPPPTSSCVLLHGVSKVYTYSLTERETETARERMHSWCDRDGFTECYVKYRPIYRIYFCIRMEMYFMYLSLNY